MARYQPEPPFPEPRECGDQLVILWDAWSEALDRSQEGA